MEEFLIEKNLYNDYLLWKNKTPLERNFDYLKKINPLGFHLIFVVEFLLNLI